MQDLLRSAESASSASFADRPARILITEDEYIVALDIKLRLRKFGFEVAGVAASGDDAILQAQENKPDLILMDVQLHGEMDGVETARQIREITDVPIIFLTANTDQDTLERASRTQAFSYLLKPYNERELKFSIEKALDHHRTACLLREANEKLEERVRSRTAELTASNQALENELQLHRRTLQELREAQALARQADQAKSQFLATISHELLTPMNGIIGTIELMLEDKLSLQQQDQIKIAQASAEDLLGIIHELLDFSRMQNGTLEFNPAAFSLREQTGAFLHPLALRGAAKSLRVNWRVADDLPENIVADPIRIGQVLVNLVDNAIKFTDRGSVDVQVSQLARESARIQVGFAIRDTGIGISPEKQKIVFEPFVQADNSFSRKYTGVGLGLPIAAQLVNMMNGKIELESQPGVGTVVRFQLWVDLPEAISLTTAHL